MSTPEPEEKTDPGILPEAVLPSNMPDLGPLLEFLRDTRVTEVFINDSRTVFVERDGKVVSAGLRLASSDTFREIITQLLIVSGESPDVINDPRGVARDISLPDGSRVHLILPPAALRGPAITIRKYPHRFTLKQLIGISMTAQVAEFLHYCVRARLNLLISGGTGSGKTTLLNALIGQIPFDERLIAIEDTPELVVKQPNSVTLRTQESSGVREKLTSRDLLTHALRMRPDRIFLGELRRHEAFDYILALNTGHAGSMTTLHANTPRAALSRLESLAMLSSNDIPLTALRKQISSAIQIIIQVQRTRDGVRRVTGIAELTGQEGETYTLQDVYTLQEIPNGDSAVPNYKLVPTGLIPTVLHELQAAGMSSPTDFFAN